MKNIIYLLGFVLIFSGIAFAACPDFSGNYIATYPPSDSWDKSFVTIQQIGCETLKWNEKITYKDGHPPGFLSYEHKLSQTPISNGYYWSDEYGGLNLFWIQTFPPPGKCMYKSMLQLREKDREMRSYSTGMNDCKTGLFGPMKFGLFYRQQ